LGQAPFNPFITQDLAGITQRNWRIWDGSLYSQDDIKVTRSLTLNLGFRYERLGNLGELNGRNASMDPSLINQNPPDEGSLDGIVVSDNFPGTRPPGVVSSGNNMGINGVSQNTLNPRIGFAWSLPGTKRLVLRGGYGVYHQRATGQPYLQQLSNQPFGLIRVVAPVLENARLYAQAQRALAELKSTQERLVQSEKVRALAEMAGGVAHDFNNLLTAILGRTQYLMLRLDKGEVSPADARRDLAVIERAAVDGAETVRREGYGPVQLPPERVAARLAAGRPATPPLAVVTRSLDLDWSSRAFTAAPAGSRTLVITCQQADPGRLTQARTRAAPCGSGVGVRRVNRSVRHSHGDQLLRLRRKRSFGKHALTERLESRSGFGGQDGPLLGAPSTCGGAHRSPGLVKHLT